MCYLLELMNKNAKLFLKSSLIYGGLYKKWTPGVAMCKKFIRLSGLGADLTKRRPRKVGKTRLFTDGVFLMRAAPGACPNYGFCPLPTSKRLFIPVKYHKSTFPS